MRCRASSTCAQLSFLTVGKMLTGALQANNIHRRAQATECACIISELAHMSILLNGEITSYAALQGDSSYAPGLDLNEPGWVAAYPKLRNRSIRVGSSAHDFCGRIFWKILKGLYADRPLWLRK